jgi:hypothetical protein
MLPELVSLAKNPQSRLQAVMAMGSTGSKDAIPILLELLKDPDAGVRHCAGYSLRLLTHRTSTQDSKGSDTGGEYMQWKKWWASEGATAPIYKDRECGKMVPLPCHKSPQAKNGSSRENSLQGNCSCCLSSLPLIG